jgi:translation initiation factor IF-1
MAAKAALAGAELAMIPEERVSTQLANGSLVRARSDWCPTFPGSICTIGAAGSRLRRLSRWRTRCVVNRVRVRPDDKLTVAVAVRRLRSSCSWPAARTGVVQPGRARRPGREIQRMTAWRAGLGQPFQAVKSCLRRTTTLATVPIRNSKCTRRRIIAPMSFLGTVLGFPHGN